MNKTFRKDLLLKLKDQELFALHSLARHLEDKGKFSVLEDAPYTAYKQICGQYGVIPDAKMDFKNHLQQLNRLKLIALKSIQSKEKQASNEQEEFRNKITLLGVSAKELLEILEKVFLLY